MGAELSSVAAGVGGRGVGAIGVCAMIFRRFQKPAFGPLITNAKVQRESPRRESGRCTAAVKREANDITNAILHRQSQLANTVGLDYEMFHLPFKQSEDTVSAFHPRVGKYGSNCPR